MCPCGTSSFLWGSFYKNLSDTNNSLSCNTKVVLWGESAKEITDFLIV